LVGQHERHLACKKIGDGGGGHWLVRIEWRPAGFCVNLPLHHKVQKFSSGHKTVVVVTGIYAFSALTLLVGWQEGHSACKKLSGEVLARVSV